MITWSARILAVFGAGHLIGATLLSFHHFQDWLLLRLWAEGDLTELSPADGAFWFGPGGLGLPLLLVGLLIGWMNQRGIVPPAFLAWTLLAWAGVCAVIVEPAPFVLIGIAAVLLLRGARRSGAVPSTDRSHREDADGGGIRR